MRILITLAAVILPAAAIAQHHEGMEPSADRSSHGMSRDADARLSQGGQAAFAAIQEVVAALESDPATDWSRVNVEALRQHLIDMDNVVRLSKVEATPIQGGARFRVTASDSAIGSIRRMTSAHGMTMGRENGWAYSVDIVRDGAVIDVTADNSGDAAKIRALGFAGILALGNHHQAHHYAIASGQPH